MKRELREGENEQTVSTVSSPDGNKKDGQFAVCLVGNSSLMGNAVKHTHVANTICSFEKCNQL